MKVYMIKRFLTIMILSVFPFLLVGCGNHRVSSVTSNPKLTIQNHNIEVKYNDATMAKGCYPVMQLSEEMQSKYPKLKPVIDKFNIDWKEDFEEHIPSDFSDNSLSDCDIYYCIEASISRFDEQLFIVKYDLSYDLGGPHGYYFTYASVYNPNDGKIIKLSDIVNNKTRLAKIIAEKIYEINPEFEYGNYYNCNNGENYKSSDIKQATELFEEMINDDKITWTINDNGLNIIFNEYDLAPHGQGGEFDFIIPYGELKNSIKSKYIITNTQAMDEIVKTEDIPVKQITIL